MYFFATLGILCAGYYLYKKYYDPRNTNRIRVKSVTQYKQSDKSTRKRCQVSSEKEFTHFENWLNYLFKLSKKKPESRSAIEWGYTENVIVKYIYNKRVYRISLQNDLTSEILPVDIDQKAYYRRIERAEIIMKHPNIAYYDDVTEYLRSFMGPNLDFYACFPTITKNLNYIFPYYDLNDWASIMVFDSFQQEHTLDLTRSHQLKWNKRFTLSM